VSRTKDSLSQILKRFPMSQVQMAFAYGSGVFQQSGGPNMTKNMIDLCLVIDNSSKKWHEENLLKNKNDYSALKHFGPEKVAQLQETPFGAKVYYNTLVKTSEDQLIKYGVISTDALITDLLDWTSLYLAGRLHKPVLYLKDPCNVDLHSAIQVNLENAVHTALLLLPEKFSEFQLYSTLASLSYTGDIRMGLAENDNKIANIVSANLENFRSLYQKSFEEPHIKQYLSFNENSRTFDQDACSNTLYHHLNYLPHTLISKIVNDVNKDGSHRDREEVMHIVKEDFRLNHKVLLGLRAIVQDSSWKQTAKGVLTAGIGKSINYAGNKVLKKLRGNVRKVETS